MKAILVTRYGPPDGLQIAEVETPTPGDHELLIKIYATTVTAGDVALRRMTGLRRAVFGLFFDLGTNKILGHELAGVIEAVGQDVRRFHPGDPVFASAEPPVDLHLQSLFGRWTPDGFVNDVLTSPCVGLGADFERRASTFARPVPDALSKRRCGRMPSSGLKFRGFTWLVDGRFTAGVLRC